MARISRKDLKTPFLHVMVQGVNKEYIFKNEKYIEKYLDIIRKNIKEYDFSILAYCIMSNHAHFLIYTENIESFGKFMQKVNLTYSMIYNRKEERCGIVFRNRYKAEPIYDVKYLLNCIKYIHENPVKANIVEKCEEYRYSSYNDYINNKGIVENKVMKRIFGPQCDVLNLIKKTGEKRFMDIEESKESLNKYIMECIGEFINENKIDIAAIFYNKRILKKLFEFLKERRDFKIIEIQNFFDISRYHFNLIRKC